MKNRKQHTTSRSNVTEWSSEIKHNDYSSRFSEQVQIDSLKNKWKSNTLPIANYIGDAGVKSLSEAIKTNTTLTELRLCGGHK